MVRRVDGEEVQKEEGRRVVGSPPLDRTLSETRSTPRKQVTQFLSSSFTYGRCFGKAFSSFERMPALALGRAC